MFKKVAKCIIVPIWGIVGWILLNIWTLIIRLSPAEKVEDHYTIRLDLYIKRKILLPFEILIPESEVYKYTVNGKEYSFIDVAFRGSSWLVDIYNLVANDDMDDDTGMKDTYGEFVDDAFKIAERIHARQHKEEL